VLPRPGDEEHGNLGKSQPPRNGNVSRRGRVENRKQK